MIDTFVSLKEKLQANSSTSKTHLSYEPSCLLITCAGTQIKRSQKSTSRHLATVKIHHANSLNIEISPALTPPQARSSSTTMTLGASPITAFFPPASSSAKRKEHPDASTRKTKMARKEGRNSSPADLSGEQKGNFKQKKISFLFRNDQGTSTHPSTPSTELRREAATLQTPPASLDITARVKSRNTTRHDRLPATNNPTSQTVFYLPTPLTNARPKRSIADVLQKSDETPCKIAKTASSSSKLLPRSLRIPIQTDPFTSIPSSQSQQELLMIPDRHTPEPAEPQFMEPNTESSPPIELEEYSHGGEDETIVASSQSQFLVPFELSPRKSKRDGYFNMMPSRQQDDCDTIPSSQSYEMELQIPERVENVPPVENTTPHRSGPSAWTFGKGKPPTRTLSDELFDVSISSSILEDLFQDDNDIDEHLEYIPNAANADQGSVTESDTDDESLPIRPLPVPLQPMRAVDRETEEELDDPQELPNMTTSDSSNSYSADCSQSADESPSSSLPSVLQEFRDMFGDSDDSYPPDFPMSLRF